MPSIAIIGAGCSGLAAAHTFQDAGYEVVLFERDNDVGGRATTGRQARFIYDYGAQYIKQGSQTSIRLITERFRADDLIDIQQPVWIFDAQGHIREGDIALNQEPKWCYRGGLITLAHLMAAQLNIHLGSSISRVEHTSDGWKLFSDTGVHPNAFDYLLITIPAPQAVELIQASKIQVDMQERICAHLNAAHYNPLLSVMLGYQPTPELRPYYALVNTDKAHPISWLAWEHMKGPERVPSGSGLLIAQMAPQYSNSHWLTSNKEVGRNVAELVNTLIDEQLPTPSFLDVQRWHYALPSATANANLLNAITLPTGLAFCGDAFAGGRVHLALENGIMMAQQIIAQQKAGPGPK